jgi:hypothetical protein
MSTSNGTKKKKSSVSNASSISASASAAPIVVKPPPADANIPSVPEGAEPTNGTDYRGIVPKKSELAVLGDVVTELENSTEFSALFGRTMPSVAYIIQVFTAANQWSVMRNKTDAWDLFARTQEGLTWLTARGLMTRMKPVFEATASANADVAIQFPSLGLLLGAAKVIAKRGATTRKGNAKSKANGETPGKGAVAKEVREAARVVADHAAPAAAQETVGTGTVAAPAAAPVTAPVAAGGATAQGATAETAPTATAGGGVNGLAAGAHS